MKYVALIRGINVGGNAIIPMATLRAAFEACDVTNVSTFIASGNVLLEAPKGFGRKPDTTTRKLAELSAS